MPKNVITPEEGAELQKLREAYTRATQQAIELLKQEGMSSEAFSKADAEAGKAAARIREILGLGKHWLS